MLLSWVTVFCGIGVGITRFCADIVGVGVLYQKPPLMRAVVVGSHRFGVYELVHFV